MRFMAAAMLSALLMASPAVALDTLPAGSPTLERLAAVLNTPKPRISRPFTQIACPSDASCCCATASGAATAQCMTKSDCENLTGGRCISGSPRC